MSSGESDESTGGDISIQVIKDFLPERFDDTQVYVVFEYSIERFRYNIFSSEESLISYYDCYDTNRELLEELKKFDIDVKDIN